MNATVHSITSDPGPRTHTISERTFIKRAMKQLRREKAALCRLEDQRKKMRQLVEEVQALRAYSAQNDVRDA